MAFMGGDSSDSDNDDDDDECSSDKDGPESGMILGSQTTNATFGANAL
eukprot:CAMPEP_0185573098 /NCGR_PEP_ID=MMETSP0434-20130131/4901_1 /TAXON_ID=626734 ORGANISM="Favella taraikaensis, Strain Fe Narragansett Bay" /NCGR_SAMPLE_ID=MMETSP0434 /ASSEMBLY_ACC=CAM_ASM_000379 /LENGTH=47 /DNA_ID= /DNA_START= /DNA_END= /DNA_ORIENTATION=